MVVMIEGRGTAVGGIGLMMRGGMRSVASAVLAAGMIVGYSGTAVSNQVQPVVSVSPADPGGPGGSDDDSGEGGIVPKPIGRNGDDAEPAQGGAAIPEPEKGAPEGADEEAPAAEPMPLPRPVGPSVPDGQIPAGMQGGPAAAQDPTAQQALAMVGPVLAKVNDLTAGLLKQFQASLPNAQATPLDFATTDVNPEQAGQIVQREDGDIDQFNETVDEVGGPDPSMKQTPVLLRDQAAGFTMNTLFDVAGKNGGPSSLVDTQGAKYKDMDDYRQNNTLSEGTQMVHPAKLGESKDGEAEGAEAEGESAGADPAELVSGPAHEAGFGEKVGDFVKQVSGAAGSMGTSLLPNA
jgi:hypothetical protein